LKKKNFKDNCLVIDCLVFKRA